jgi:serine/threonine-protein kinase
MKTVRGSLRGIVRLSAAYVATALLAAFVTIRFFGMGSVVAVPNLAGLDLKQVKAALSARRLEMTLGGEEWSEAVPAGCVIGQQPAAATRVKHGRRVAVVLSRGSEKVTLPSFVDSALDDAEFLLRQLGLEIAGLSTVPSIAAKRRVLAQSPAPGTTVTRGQQVQLLISDGRAPATIPIPLVTGLPTRDALARLREAGLKIAEVTYEATTIYADGTVFAQDPPGGFRDAAGDAVRLKAARSGASSGLARFVTFSFTVPDGQARRVRTMIVDEAGTVEIGSSVEEGGRVLRFSTRVQGDAVAQFFVGGTLVEERKL